MIKRTARLVLLWSLVWFSPLPSALPNQPGGHLSPNFFGPLASTEIGWSQTGRIVAGIALLIALIATFALLWSRTLRRQVLQRTRDLTLLNRVITAATAAPTPQQILEITCRELVQTFNLTTARASLFNPDRSQANIIATYSGSAAEIGTRPTPIPGNPAIDHILQSGTPYVAESAPGSLLAIPITVRGQVAGSIELVSAAKKWQEQEISLALNAAAAAAQALENAQLLEEERKSHDISDTLSEIARELNSIANLDTALNQVLQHLQQVVDLDSGSILLLEGNHLSVTAIWGFANPEGMLEAKLDLNLAELNRQVIESKEPIIVGSVKEDHRWQAPTKISNLPQDLEQIHSWIGVPLIIQDRVIGMLTADKTEPYYYTAQDAELALAFAGHAAVAIENARLRQSELEKLRLAETLQKVGALLTARLGLEEVLERILDLLAAVIEFDCVSIQLLNDEGHLEMTAGRGFPDQQVAERALATVGDQTLQSRWKDQDVIVIPDTHQDERWVTGLGVDFIRSWIGVALRVRGELIGVLNVDSATANAYNESLAVTVATFGHQAAVAIQNARLFNQAQHELQERKRAERETLERQTYLEALLAAAPDAILTLDKEHRILEWNAGAEELFGYKKEEVIGAPLDPLITQEYNLEEATDFTNFLLQKHAIPPTEVVRHRKDGSPVNVLVAGSPIVIDGELIGGVATYTNITDRIKAENELEQRARQQVAINAIIAAATGADDLQKLLETALDHTLQALDLEIGAIWTGQHHVLRNLSSELARQLRQASRLDHLDLPHPVIVENWEEQSQQESRQHKRDLIQKRGVHASITVPVVADGGRIGGLSVSSTEPRSWTQEEITLLETIGRQLGSAVERLRLLDRIREQVQRIHQIVDTVPEGVLLLGSNYHIILANPAAQKYLSVLTNAQIGEPLEHLGNRPLTDLLAPLPPHRTWHELQLEGPPIQTFAINAQPIQSIARQENEWVMAIRDISQERRVQQQIQQQERLAAVGQLAAGIAHDFNNIMAVIVLYAQMSLRTRNLPSKVNERLQTILSQARHAADLIQQILDFSRRSVLERRSMSLVPFLKELVKMLERTLPENIKLSLDCDSEDLLVHADPTRMQQMLMNLSLNARDAMPQGGLLHMTLHKQHFSAENLPPVQEIQEGDWIEIALTDSGIGISAEIMPHIFEPFFTTRAPLGTGLGLSQVYGIVRQHGGYVNVESPSPILHELTEHPGPGTTFSIFLPALDSSDEIPDFDELLEVPEGTGELILVVEDDPVTREALVDSLEILNYGALAAANGQQALEICRQHGDQIALLLSDVVMPEMGGTALFQAVQQEFPSIKRVAITGHPLDEVRDTQLDDVIAWLQKPISLEQLAEVIEKALHRPEVSALYEEE